MFTDARIAPVHVSSSYTLTSSGLRDFLQDKLYNTARTGAEFKKCLQDTAPGLTLSGGGLPPMTFCYRPR